LVVQPLPEEWDAVGTVHPALASSTVRLESLWMPGMQFPMLRFRM